MSLTLDVSDRLEMRSGSMWWEPLLELVLWHQLMFLSQPETPDWTPPKQISSRYLYFFCEKVVISVNCTFDTTQLILFPHTIWWISRPVMCFIKFCILQNSDHGVQNISFTSCKCRCLLQLEGTFFALIKVSLEIESVRICMLIIFP